MTGRVVNLALYFVTFALIATGTALFTTNRAAEGWLYEAHRYFGAALCILLLPKTLIIERALLRRVRNDTWRDVHTLGGIVLTLLLILSLVAVLAWTLNLLPFWIQLILVITPLALHWYTAVALVPFFLWHSWVRGLPALCVANISRGRVRSELTRRHALELIGIGALGIVGWIALDGAAGMSDWLRRFSGSRVINSFRGNEFPVTNGDTPPMIDIQTWRLRLEGASLPTELNYADLLALATESQTATLDCTLGWASTQNWRGVSMKQLLQRAGLEEWNSVSVYAANGALVLLSKEDVAEALIATHVGDEPLSQEHGYPARLVLASRRGYQWIKWMNRIVVS